MRLLLLPVGLSLLSVVPAQELLLIPASSHQLLGAWHIVRWAGNMPIPEERTIQPLPPFRFVRNKLDKLEFRMNLRRPIGCVQFQLLLDFIAPGTFETWWKHTIFIHFLPGKHHAIAYFKGKKHIPYQMMMLMGRTLEKDPEALRIFKNFVGDKGLKKIYAPSQREACELPRES